LVIFCLGTPLNVTSRPSLMQRNCAAGWVSFDQKWKTRTRIEYSADSIRGAFKKFVDRHS